jgi:NitT/TauT family transport system permease protein
MSSEERQGKHIHRFHKHVGFSYPASFIQKVYSIILGPFAVVILLAVLSFFFARTNSAYAIHALTPLSLHVLLFALAATLGRLFLAYLVSVFVAVPLAIFITWKPQLETVFLPIFDILESIPILAFFPVIILIFFKYGFFNAAAIFIIFLDMVWNLLFTLIGGIKLIPQEVKDAATIYKVTGIRYFFKVLLPALVPQLVTGSILAFGQGWNIIIVAEVMHVYVPHGSSAQDLFGIGSLLVQASGNGETAAFLAAITVMVVAIAFLNFFVWQKLLHFSQKFRFE